MSLFHISVMVIIFNQFFLAFFLSSLMKINHGLHVKIIFLFVVTFSYSTIKYRLLVFIPTTRLAVKDEVLIHKILEFQKALQNYF